ncbi:competence protein F [Desulfohalobium retbaense DSM 5692]|uniref:Competence protein F n=2 Tax=Desulfohalobium TaxID=45662 RepID=C8X4X0_DESRD|nr:competence protein F [Desulfohalobium retbaense DSM 5692]
MWRGRWLRSRGVADAVKTWSRRLAGRLAPGRCLYCGAVLDAPGAGESLCHRCAPFFAPRPGGFCPGCGQLLEDEAAPLHLCRSCRDAPQPWEQLAFFGVYQGPLREVILEYKLQGRLGHTALLAACLSRCYRLHFAGGGWDTLVPVPLHRTRLRRRGFNQSCEPLKGWGAQEGLELVVRGLERVRPTPSQTGLHKTEREHNMRDAFAVFGEISWHERNVLLVDDVFTTGATLSACARRLCEAGVARLGVLTMARAE